MSTTKRTSYDEAMAKLHYVESSDTYEGELTAEEVLALEDHVYPWAGAPYRTDRATLAWARGGGKGTLTVVFR